MDELDLGRCPVDNTATGAVSLQDSEAYAALQGELDKLTDMHADSQVDWARVVQLASQVLRHECKDLSAAMYLLLGLTHTGGLPGLVSGVQILRDLIECYWDTLTPPLTRLRARRNRAEWLLEQLDVLLQGEHVPLAAAQYAALQEGWAALDRAWSAHDDTAPAFYRLTSKLGALAVAEEAPAETAALEGEGGQADAVVQGAQMAVSDTLPEAIRVAPGALKTIKPPLPALPELAQVDGLIGRDAHAATEQILQAFSPLIVYWLEHQHTSISKQEHQ